MLRDDDDDYYYYYYDDDDDHHHQQQQPQPLTSFPSPSAEPDAGLGTLSEGLMLRDDEAPGGLGVRARGAAEVLGAGGAWGVQVGADTTEGVVWVEWTCMLTESRTTALMLPGAGPVRGTMG